MKKITLFLSILFLSAGLIACAKSESSSAPKAKVQAASMEKGKKGKGQKQTGAKISKACQKEFASKCERGMEKRWKCIKDNMSSFSTDCSQAWKARQAESRKQKKAKK